MDLQNLDAHIAAELVNKCLPRPGENFYIGDFDKLCRLLSYVPPKGVYDRLHALHCKSWHDMAQIVRDFVVASVRHAVESGPGVRAMVDESGRLILEGLGTGAGGALTE